jgi:hypothetical protein
VLGAINKEDVLVCAQEDECDPSCLTLLSKPIDLTQKQRVIAGSRQQWSGRALGFGRSLELNPNILSLKAAINIRRAAEHRVLDAGESITRLPHVLVNRLPQARFRLHTNRPNVT